MYNPPFKLLCIQQEKYGLTTAKKGRANDTEIITSNYTHFRIPEFPRNKQYIWVDGAQTSIPSQCCKNSKQFIGLDHGFGGAKLDDSGVGSG